MLIYVFCALLLFTGQLLGGAHTENIVEFGESLWEHPLATGRLSLLSVQKKVCPCPQGPSSQAGR